MKTPKGSANVDVNITKVLIYAVGGLAVIGVGFILLRKISKSIQGLKEKSEQQDVVKEAQKTINPSSLTYDKIWYESKADRLMSAFEGGGTSEKTVYNIFRGIKTNDDLNQLIVSFGTRTGKSGYVGKVTGNLSTWLEEELSSREMNKVKEILQDNNVVFNL